MANPEDEISELIDAIAQEAALVSKRLTQIQQLLANHVQSAAAEAVVSVFRVIDQKMRTAGEQHGHGFAATRVALVRELEAFREAKAQADLDRIELHHISASPYLFGGKRSRAAAAKTIENDSAAL